MASVIDEKDWYSGIPETESPNPESVKCPACAGHGKKNYGKHTGGEFMTAVCYLCKGSGWHHRDIALLNARADAGNLRILLLARLAKQPGDDQDLRTMILIAERTCDLLDLGLGNEIRKQAAHRTAKMPTPEASGG